MPDGYEDALTSWPLGPSRHPIRPDQSRLPRDHIRCFAAFQAGHGRSDDPAKVTARHVRDYITTRQNETSPGTTGIDYRNLRSFCNRLVRADDLSASLMANIGHPSRKPTSGRGWPQPVRVLKTDRRSYKATVKITILPAPEPPIRTILPEGIGIYDLARGCGRAIVNGATDGRRRATPPPSPSGSRHRTRCCTGKQLTVILMGPISKFLQVTSRKHYRV